MSAVLQDRSIGTGRLGIAEPSPTQAAPALCVVMLHPPVTYNPWSDATWCLCGSKTWAGDRAMHGVACCDGPLIVQTPPALSDPKEEQK